jgi:hypothetical protein
MTDIMQKPSESQNLQAITRREHVIKKRKGWRKKTGSTAIFLKGLQRVLVLITKPHLVAAQLVPSYSSQMHHAE